jgi:photosystem II stability/assembly factor-like uncharacterized protein
MSNTQHGWTVLDNGQGLYTYDGGSTWDFYTVGQNSNALNYSYNSGSSLWVIGDNSTVYYYPNGATNWIFQNIQQSGSSLKSIHGYNVNSVWIAGSNGPNAVLYHTVDSGSNWIPNTGVYFPGSLNSIYLNATGGIAGGYSGNNTRIIYTTDSGISWSNSNLNAPGRVNGVYYDATYGWACGVDNSGNGVVYKSTNHGLDWTSQTLPRNRRASTIGELYDIQFVDLNIGWAVGVKGTVIYTANSGATWIQQNTGITNDLSGLYFVDSLNGWASGAGGAIINTNSGGN